MIWTVEPTGKRARQPVHNGAEDQRAVWQTVVPTNAAQTGPMTQHLRATTLRQTTGVVKRLRCLIGLDNITPNFSTPGRPLPCR